MLLDLLDPTTRASVIEHRDAEGPLVDDVPAGQRVAGCLVLILFEECRDDKWLEDEPAAEIHALDAVRGVVPLLVKRGRPRLRTCTVVVRVGGIIDP